MNKKQLIARVRRYMGPGATRSSATAALDAVLHAIGQSTQAASGQPPICPKARLPQFGSFRQASRRSGLRLTFRPSAHLRRELTEHQE